ncbi:DUF6907 domain-containing protein [Streptomyces meridianus]|uniref:Uncharacterized protein n=1 Tax=Streptomyces meridianus TaxID=2938945 RepID=A0ABT0XDG9_9ACTN|nr:hypothetical protein [Streptomyces meridianus]MCM2580469.1 hypothetical protein [Streptomyces meridianus]
MSRTARTVTVRTLDRGPVTMAEPSWCVGHPDNAPEQYLADVIHEGPETTLAFRGCQTLTASLSAAPYSEVYSPEVSVCVELNGDCVRLDPAGLDELAAALVERAAELRRLARQLSVLRTSGRDSK